MIVATQPQESVQRASIGNANIPPHKLAHFVVLTSELKPMRDWYQTVLAGRISYENEMIAFLAYDDEHHRIGIVNIPALGARPPGVKGVDHIAFTYKDLGELLVTYRRLKQAGIEPFWTINHGPTTSMYYRDPDGNKIELQVDNFTVAECDQFFAEGNYEENFMGIVFDPEEMIARFEAGVPAKELTRRGKLPEGMTAWDMHRP